MLILLAVFKAYPNDSAMPSQYSREQSLESVTVFLQPDAQSEGKCGPCNNGVCIVHKCFCDRGFQGESCSELGGWTDRECSLEPLSDNCMDQEGYGRLSTFSAERYAKAGACELDFWKKVDVPHRNPTQIVTMHGFRDLPKELGHVLELGSGPYTKIRLLLQEGEVRRSHVDLKSITLEDPLLFSYTREAKATSWNENGQLCLASTESWDASSNGGCVPTIMAPFGAEKRFPRHAYDTVIMMNVIEHCRDARLVLQNLYESLKPGGWLVFGEEYENTGNGIGATSNLCHPLKIHKRFFEEFIDMGFDAKFVDADLPEWKKDKSLHPGALKSIYTIARKRN
jgi:SAM-dependent methyltransferase